MNSYELKLEAKKQRLLDAADRADQASNTAYQSSHNATSGIPFGQPILVGHHSEGRHRRAIDKAWNQMGKSVALSDKADKLRIWRLCFRTGHDRDPRYVLIKDNTLNGAETQLFNMYCSINTILLGSKEIFNEN